MARMAEGVRLCMFAFGGESRIGAAVGGKVADLTRAYALSLSGTGPEEALARACHDVPQTVEASLRWPDLARRVRGEALRALRRAGRDRRFDGAPVLHDPAALRFLPPLRPPRVLCMARNYEEHGKEFEKHLKMRRDRFTLFGFLKPHTAVQGAFDPVAVPPSVEKLDYEIELAVVIGKGGRNIPRRQAMQHVAGYTIVNDMSDRAGIPPGGTAGGRIDWFKMKARDGFAPLGPYLLLAGEGIDPYKMRLRLWVNGQLRQNALAREMVHKIDAQIAFFSQIVTLQVGDVIATGSPAGNAPKWGQWLKPGDDVMGEVQGIGRQRFRIVRDDGRYRTSWSLT
ncbi:MAG: fumarylacetoacetate hydrolase family protein [Candidatus Methylomirabilia bacterium]